MGVLFQVLVTRRNRIQEVQLDEQIYAFKGSSDAKTPHSCPLKQDFTSLESYHHEDYEVNNRKTVFTLHESTGKACM